MTAKKTTLVVKEETNAITRRRDELNALLVGEDFFQSLRKMATEYLTPEKVVKMVLVAASRQPNIFQCTPQSILQSAMSAATVGLEFEGLLGEAYLIPYKNNKAGGVFECKYMIGYRGYIVHARRSGQIARIESRIVYEHDIFDVEFGLNQKLSHKPTLDGERGAIRCAYAICEMIDGSSQVEVMSLEEIEKIRGRSPAGKSGPWVTDYSEMARKTVIRRLAKYLPLSREMARGINADDKQFDIGITADMMDGIKGGAKTGLDGLKSRMVIPGETKEPPTIEVPLKDVTPDDPPAKEAKPEAKAGKDGDEFVF